NELAKNQTRAFYFYDLNEAARRARWFLKRGHQIHFAMKANSHPRLLRLFTRMNLGVDVVSLGEMQKALANGFTPQRVIFSGVGKGAEELAAALHAGIAQINVESFEELKMLAEICERDRRRCDL